jgi:SAM-dependent methyltransferase
MAENKFGEIRFCEEIPNTGRSSLGCRMRDGFLTSKLSRIFREVVGIDPSLSGIKFAKSKAKDNMSLIVGSAEKLPFKHNSFDKVTLFEVIEHIPENQVESVVGEISRVLKGRGKIIVTTPNSHNLINRILKREKVSLKHEREYSYKELLQIFGKFRTLELSGIYLPIPILHFFCKPHYRFIYATLIRFGKIFPKLSLFTFGAWRK